MVKAERFPPTVESALARRQIDAVLHFSRRSAHAYIDCASRAGLLDCALAPLHFCLSRQVAEPLATPSVVAQDLVTKELVTKDLASKDPASKDLAARDVGGIRIAPRPDEAALIALVNSGG
jgi:hypothetical protein